LTRFPEEIKMPTRPPAVALSPASLAAALLLLLSLAAPAAVAQETGAVTDTLKRTAPIPQPKLDQQAMEKLGWRLGSQAYTFRKLSLFETIDLLNAMGIRYIEMYPGQRFSPQRADVKADHHMSDELVDELIAKLKEKNVTPVLYGVVGLPNDEAKSRKVFEYAKKLKLEGIVSEPPKDAIPLIDRLAGEYGIKVAIHNHPKPSPFYDCKSVIEATKDAKHVAACADIGHWRRSELTPVECVKMLEGKIISLHVKDIDEQKHDVVWGTGRVDVRAVLEELHRQQAKNLIFSIEYEKGEGDELVANVAKSVEFFNAVVGELAAK
jgi:sugar phosphate isomerase/epimerase